MKLGSSRGSTEIIFVALFTGIVLVGVAAGGPLVNALTDSTESEVTKPEFELSSTDPIEISYTGGGAIRASETEEIYLVPAENPDAIDDNRYPIYPDMPNIDEGTVVFNSSENAWQHIGYGETVAVVWDGTEGNGEVLTEFYIPSSNVTGTSINSNGSISLNDSAVNVSTE